MTVWIKPEQVRKFSLILVTGTALALLLHQGYPDPWMTLTTKPKGVVLTSGWLPPIASVALALSFGVIGLIFGVIQRMLHHVQGTVLRPGKRE